MFDGSASDGSGGIRFASSSSPNGSGGGGISFSSSGSRSWRRRPLNGGDGGGEGGGGEGGGCGGTGAARNVFMQAEANRMRRNLADIRALLAPGMMQSLFAASLKVSVARRATKWPAAHW